MRDWGVMLGGLIVWTLHFLVVYGIASIADVSDPAIKRLWAVASLVGSAWGLAALVWIGSRARERPALVRQLGIGGCVLAGVAIVFQSLPLLVSG